MLTLNVSQLSYQSRFSCNIVHTWQRAGRWCGVRGGSMPWAVGGGGQRAVRRSPVTTTRPTVLCVLCAVPVCCWVLWLCCECASEWADLCCAVLYCRRPKRRPPKPRYSTYLNTLAVLYTLLSRPSPAALPTGSNYSAADRSRRWTHHLPHCTVLLFYRVNPWRCFFRHSVLCTYYKMFIGVYPKQLWTSHITL